MIKRMSLLASLGVMLISPGCGETLFQSNFDPTPANQPPAAAQAVGTAAVFGPSGSVLVVDPPVQPSGKWVRISRPTGPQVAGFQGNFSASRGDGEYTFTTTVFMPTGSGPATIQFEPFGQQVETLSSFLHLDLMPKNTVRVDDEVDFGTFPRDQPFIVQVTLNIQPTAANAHIVLSGAGASGTFDRAIRPALLPMARQFGAVRLWQGFPHTGRFEATNIVVSHRT